MDDTEVRLINAYELERMVKERCGLDGIKFLELIRDCKTVAALPIEYGDKQNGRTHDTRTENASGSTP